MFRPIRFEDNIEPVVRYRFMPSIWADAPVGEEVETLFVQ